MISNNHIHRLRGDDDDDDDDLSAAAQRQLLAHLATLPGESISTSEAQAFTGLCQRATREYLRRLVKAGLLVEGRERYANNRPRLRYALARHRPTACAAQQARQQALAVREAHPLCGVWA